MLLEQIHRHRTLFGIIVFGPIILTFVMWGGSFGGGGSRSRGGENAGPAVATAGGIPIAAAQFRSALNQEIQRRSQYGQEVTREQLLVDGTAQRVLDSLVEREMLAKESAELPFRFKQDFLAEKLKEHPNLQDENGSFDAKAWNELVERDDINWGEIYDGLAADLRRALLVQERAASARVFDADVLKDFREEKTKIQVRYASVEPAIEPTDEQVRAQFDKDPSVYDVPEQCIAEYAAVSLEPPPPAILDELVQKARAGEDFAELAKAHSIAPTKDKGGDLGWITQSPALPEHQRVLFEMKSGDVSDPVKTAAGYAVFKVLETRKSEVADQVDVRASEIWIRPELSDEERAAREKKAEAIAERAAADGDLAAAAQEAGVEVKRTGEFSSESFAIDNLPDSDASAFRMAALQLDKDAVSEVITARENLYVAKIVEVKPPQPQPFEDVREEVLTDTIREIERSEEYAKKVADYVEQIKEEASSLEEAGKLFPELNMMPKETKPFSVRDYDFQSGPPWNPQAVFDAVADLEEGGFTGPVSDYLGKSYFVELASRIVPDEATLQEEWEKVADERREMALMQAQNERVRDYLLDLRQQNPWQLNQDMFMRILGIDQGDDDSEPAQAPDETDAEPADEFAPAETAAEAPAEAGPEEPARE